MTPTDAAREIVDAQNTHVRHNLSGLYGPDIARALLDAEATLTAFRSLLVNVVPGDGSGIEAPATPDSLLAYIAELHGEWDDAEERIAALKSEVRLLQRSIDAVAVNHECDGYPSCQKRAGCYRPKLTPEGGGK